MNNVSRGVFVVCASLVSVLGCTSVASANARLEAPVGTAVPNGATIKYRSVTSTPAKFVLPSGLKIECFQSAGPPPLHGSLGTGTVSTNIITGTDAAGTWTGVGSISSLIFGNSMPVTQTTSSKCTSTITGLPTCTLTVNTPLTIDAQIKSNGAAADTGVNVRVYKSLGLPIVPVILIIQCHPTGGGGPLTCVYKGGTAPGSEAVTNGFAAYDAAMPQKAGTIALTNQSFYKDAGASAAQCPATSSMSPAQFSASYNLFYTSGAGATNQVYAVKTSTKP